MTKRSLKNERPLYNLLAYKIILFLFLLDLRRRSIQRDKLRKNRRRSRNAFPFSYP